MDSERHYVTVRMFWSTVVTIAMGLAGLFLWFVDTYFDYIRAELAPLRVMDIQIEERIDRSDNRLGRHNLRLMLLENDDGQTAEEIERLSREARVSTE